MYGIRWGTFEFDRAVNDRAGLDFRVYDDVLVCDRYGNPFRCDINVASGFAGAGSYCAAESQHVVSRGNPLHHPVAVVIRSTCSIEAFKKTDLVRPLDQDADITRGRVIWSMC